MADDDQPRMTSSPLTGTLFDDHGNPLVSGDTSGATFPLDDRVVEFVEYGVLNSSFSRHPLTNEFGNIEDINPLPDWSGPVSVSGGSITAQIAADVSSPSGYNLRFNVAPGAAGDEAYFEQIVPIGGSRNEWGAHILRATAICVSNPDVVEVRLNAQYLDAGFNTAGTDSAGGGYVAKSPGPATGNVAFLLAAPNYAGAGNFKSNMPSTARYLRVRIGVARAGAATSSTAVLDISDVRVDKGGAALLMAPIPLLSPPGTYGPALFQQVDGAVVLNAGYDGSSTTVPTFQFGPGGFSYTDSDGLVATLPSGSNAQLGIQATRTAISSIASGASHTDTVTWPTPFLDGNYTVSLGIQQAGFTAHNITAALSGSPIAASISVRSVNEDSGAHAYTLHAIAVHD